MLLNLHVDAFNRANILKKISDSLRDWSREFFDQILNPMNFVEQFFFLKQKQKIYFGFTESSSGAKLPSHLTQLELLQEIKKRTDAHTLDRLNASEFNRAIRLVVTQSSHKLTSGPEEYNLASKLEKNIYVLAPRLASKRVSVQVFTSALKALLSSQSPTTVDEVVELSEKIRTELHKRCGLNHVVFQSIERVIDELRTRFERKNPNQPFTLQQLSKSYKLVTHTLCAKGV
jgi:hypothetical protein